MMRATSQHGVLTGYKRCGDCNEVKPRDAFVKRARSRDGLYSYCCACHSRHQRERDLANPERTKQKRRRYSAGLYGLTLEEYDAILDRGCSICGATESERRLGIDHDHATDAVRGALCIQCNAALGQLGDDPALIRRAAAYVEAIR